MSGVKAEWGLRDLLMGEGVNPMDEVVYSTGIEVNLSSSTLDELAGAFVELLLREGALAQGGLACGLKAGGQDCRTCKMACMDRTDKRSTLCRVGKDQFAVEESLRLREVKRTEARRADYAALGAFAEAHMELAEAVLA